MADDYLLTLLADGADRWNSWRAAEPDKGLDLSTAVLADADLRGFNFADVNLSRAILRNARLDGADLSRADLSFANLQGAKLQGAKVAGVSFLGANLTGADVTGVDFTDTKITGATYDQPELSAKAEQIHQRLLNEQRRAVELYAQPVTGQFSLGGAHMRGEGHAEFVGAAVSGLDHDFEAVIDCGLTPEQVQAALTALADYYRKCGGVGFKIRYRLEEAHVEEFARAR